MPDLKDVKLTDFLIDFGIVFLLVYYCVCGTILLS